MTRVIAVVICAAGLAACAARVPPRPAGNATPDPTAIEAFRSATASCKGLQSMSGALRLSGRAGTEKLRGTLLSGLAAPASIRFEAVAPFGPPGFILAGRNNRATLFIPRESRVLRDAEVPALLERLTGLNLSASDLRLVITGCLTDSAAPSDGKTFAGDWQSVALNAPGSSPVTAYLRPINGTRIVVAADYGSWRIDYANHLNGYPRSVRIRSADGGAIDLTAAIDQLEINAGIDPSAFTVSVPANAANMSLEDLRSVAPLREPR